MIFSDYKNKKPVVQTGFGLNSKHQPSGQGQLGMSIVATTTNENPPGYYRECLQWGEVVKSYQGYFLWYSLAVFYPALPEEASKLRPGLFCSLSLGSVQS
jgi:hypothetical protein